MRIRARGCRSGSECTCGRGDWDNRPSPGSGSAAPEEGEAAASSARTTLATNRSEPGRAQAVATCQSEETMSSDRWIGAYAPADGASTWADHAIGQSPAKSNPLLAVNDRPSTDPRRRGFDSGLRAVNWKTSLPAQDRLQESRRRRQRILRAAGMAPAAKSGTGSINRPGTKVHAPKISKTTPCKVAGGGRHSRSKLTRRANQRHSFIIPQSCKRPSRPAIAGASVAIAAEKSSPATETAPARRRPNDRLRVTEPRARAERAALRKSRHEHRS